ncbi:hypothetical protein NHH82_00755 [Oxalobacteraceae bacterium OTU3REALA1]|nr:hypothetical protein NHH82_00755 [Oxalobacteraceae bacterium OTU3REALA1]
MTDEEAKEAALIAKYKAESISQRSRRKPMLTPEEQSLSVKAHNGVFTVRFALDAKPVSELGGVSKVLGLSRISIPDFKKRSN